MPDKRQTSKQRRAARNRAYREAMMARRENAAAERAASTNASISPGGLGRGGGRTGRGPGPRVVQTIERTPGVRAPGDRAVLVMLLIAVGASILSGVGVLSWDLVRVAASGKPLNNFVGVSREATAILRGTEPVELTETNYDAYGVQAVIGAVLPAIVAAGIFVLHRRRVQGRQLTIALFVLVLVTVLNPFFVAALIGVLAPIALAVAAYQVRKVEMAVPAPAGGRPGGDVIDVEEVKEGDAGEPDGGGRTDDDVLAELEEEIAKERDDEDEGGTGGTGKGRDRPSDG